jgi:hypothetical protein
MRGDHDELAAADVHMALERVDLVPGQLRRPSADQLGDIRVGSCSALALDGCATSTGGG